MLTGFLLSPAVNSHTDPPCEITKANIIRTYKWISQTTNYSDGKFKDCYAEADSCVRDNTLASAGQGDLIGKEVSLICTGSTNSQGHWALDDDGTMYINGAAFTIILFDCKTLHLQYVGSGNNVIATTDIVYRKI